MRLGAGIELSLVGYHRLLDQLVVRSRLPDPTLAQALVQDGEGRSYGAQILLAPPRGRHYGWIAYTLSRSERRYGGDSGYPMTSSLCAAIPPEAAPGATVSYCWASVVAAAVGAFGRGQGTRSR